MAGEHWLDTLGKALARGEGRTRKEFLKLVGATVLGVLEAGNCVTRRPCPPAGTGATPNCCQGQCVNILTNTRFCGSCDLSFSQCGAGLVCCGGNCCKAGEFCDSSGRCSAACSPACPTGQ